jgi:hypothetical protein
MLLYFDKLRGSPFFSFSFSLYFAQRFGSLPAAVDSIAKSHLIRFITIASTNSITGLFLYHTYSAILTGALMLTPGFLPKDNALVY